MIKILKKPDIKPAHRLMSELGYEISENDFHKNLSLIQKQESAVFISKEGNEVVGLLIVKINTSLIDGKFVEIIALIVSENYRRRGIGRLLVEKAEEWTKKQTNLIRVRSNIIREESHKFYTELGFTPNKTQILYKKNV